MDFFELIEKTNNVDVGNKNDIVDIVNRININSGNFNKWVDNVFSDEVFSFDMGKLPYLIDELYKTDDKIKFMLCCMLLESTCTRLNFITKLEDYPLFAAMFETLVNTLVTVYELVNNGIDVCMALIIINNDYKFEYFDAELKNRLIIATREKLESILKYLKKGDINPEIYLDLEVIIDLSCYLNDKVINALIDEFDNLGLNENADIFINHYLHRWLIH